MDLHVSLRHIGGPGKVGNEANTTNNHWLGDPGNTIRTSRLTAALLSMLIPVTPFGSVDEYSQLLA